MHPQGLVPSLLLIYKMNKIKNIDYLFYGDGLKTLVNSIEQYFNISNKNDLLCKLKNQGRLSKYSADIIKGYKGDNQLSIDVKQFKYDLLKTFDLQYIFKTLNCRGFSYSVIDDFNLNCYLNSTTNFKLALIVNKELYYPLRLRNYFPRDPLKWDKNHLIVDGNPSIAFALGKITNRNLYICTLQSDLIHRKPSYIREYLKGWRKILFAEILNYVKDKNIKNIFLCTSKDILRTCKPVSEAQVLSLSGLFQVYDNTAESFNMNLIKLNKLFNIQILKNSPEIFTNHMYHLNIKE
jgi:hypothetical protein